MPQEQMINLMKWRKGFLMDNKEKINILIDYTPNKVYEESPELLHNDDFEMICDVIVPRGSEEMVAIGTAEEVKVGIRFEGVEKSHVYFQYIKGFISALVTEDPTCVHFDIVRATLRKIDPGLLEDKSLIDMMARALIAQCRKLNPKINAPKHIQDQFNKANEVEEKFPPQSGRVQPYLKVAKLNLSPADDALFVVDDMFIWDKALSEVLESTGINGRDAAYRYEEKFQARLASYKMGSSRPVDYWFNTKTPTPNEPFHISPSLQMLMNQAYNDIIKKSLDFGKKYPPAISNNIYHSVNIIHKGTIQESDSQIKVINEGSVIGSLPIAAIDQNIYNRVFRGIDKFRTVTGHRLLRFLPQQAHTQLAHGINPCNILVYPGGYAQIAQEGLGLKGEKVVGNVKDVLHGLAFMQWKFQDFEGNFIVLGAYKSAATRNQHDGVKITLGPELSPYYASKHRSLLIPILKDPQLVGSPQFYANQYLLQNEIMAEFSHQSIRLAQDGIVILSDDIWERGMLPKRIKNLVKDCWTKDGDNGEQFLERIDKDAYTLGPSYHKELLFLKEQGALRLKKSEDAKRAHGEKREKKAQRAKNYSK